MNSSLINYTRELHLLQQSRVTFIIDPFIDIDDIK